MIRLPVTLALILALQSCAALPPMESPAPTALTTGQSHWNIGSVWGKVTTTDAPITVAFDGANMISGFSGCNRYTAKYSLEGRRLKISDISTTTQNTCDADARAQEERLFEALELTRWARPEDGDVLLGARRGHGVPVRLTPATPQA